MECENFFDIVLMGINSLTSTLDLLLKIKIQVLLSGRDSFRSILGIDQFSHACLWY